MIYRVYDPTLYKICSIVLVNTLWKEGKVDEAILTVEQMEKRGVVGSAAVYYDLARCLCSAGRCEVALVQVNTIYVLFYVFWAKR